MGVRERGFDRGLGVNATLESTGVLSLEMLSASQILKVLVGTCIDVSRLTPTESGSE